MPRAPDNKKLLFDFNRTCVRIYLFRRSDLCTDQDHQAPRAYFWFIFSELLEPFAILPQLLMLCGGMDDRQPASE